VRSSTPDQPKLVVSDLDGTLLRSDGSLSERTISALATLARIGVPVLFATARPAQAVRRMLGGLPFATVAICSNGAAIVDVRTGRIRRSRTLKLGEVRQIIRYVRSQYPNATIAVDTTLGRFVDHNWPTAIMSVDGQPALWQLPWNLLHSSRVLCVMVMGAWTDLHSVPDSWHARVTSGEVRLIEFSDPSASKLSALEWYGRQVGIRLSDMVAFGDMPNDLDVLLHVGRGYAVSNAHPSVLAQARYRTESNDQDGVAVVLERILDSKLV